MTPRSAVLAALAALVLLGCTQETISVDVRSLERSGRSAFLCLEAPGTAPGVPITDCSRLPASSPDDYGVDAEGNTTLPHLYALVTQTTRGEVAVVDLTTEVSPVLDLDPEVPGANFLPVGAQPIDIATTPGGTAAFVTVAEIGRPGIFALPSTQIRPCAGCAAPTLSSWPACSLPSAPGEILVVSDPVGPDGVERGSCDAAYGDVEPAGANGDLGREALGRQKLVVTMPDLGGFVVVDAQQLLDRAPGSFDACPVERWVPLRVELTPPAVPPAPPAGAACVNPEVPALSGQPIGGPRPAGLASAGDRLYIADLEAPVIHVVDFPTPCEPVERDPLLPTSLEDPSRVVTTSRLAVTRVPTPDFRRYLYAVDVVDGSTMVFDVSDGAAHRTPITRPHPEWNPFQAPDRIRFQAPVRDLIIIDRDAPAVNPVTGVAPGGVRCDPDPSLPTCDAATATCDLSTLYRTDTGTYASGAGPLRLRGTFAFIVLTSGQIAIIDIDDLDAACRAPRFYSTIAGCPPIAPPPDFAPPPGSVSGDVDADGVADGVDSCPFVPNPPPAAGQAQPDADGNGIGDACDNPRDGEGAEIGLASSNEASCNVVIPHTPRSASFIVSNDLAGRHEPGLQIFPQLFDRAGTVIPISEAASPVMRATVPEGSKEPLAVTIGGSLEAIEPSGLVLAEDGPRHTLVMNFEDPRAHVVDQQWVIAYEGALPGFGGNFADLQLPAADGEHKLVDPNARFCDRGVQSEASVRERLIAGGAAEPDAAARARDLADYVQIASELTDDEDAYWTAPQGACSFNACKAEFGTLAAPTISRELTITEAYQDQVRLEEKTAEELALIRCCYPGQIQFNVRARGQWVALSQATGFLHHVVADPATGVCRDSCDPAQARRNGRILPAPPCERTLTGELTCDPIVDGDPFAFKNAMFRLAISNGPVEPEPDTAFRFVTQASFPALVINLAAATGDIQPQAIRFIPATGELAITDGSLEGLILLNPGSVDVSRQYF